MVMHARKTAIGFYEKQGYAVFGNEFEEVTVPHFEMRKLLF
jgi:predicted GNAT family N-acyltransferase